MRPNLQNIPLRTELGRRIREVLATSHDPVILNADYSQIEQRLVEQSRVGVVR